MAVTTENLSGISEMFAIVSLIIARAPISWLLQPQAGPHTFSSTNIAICLVL
jgi:hypothetical protein